MNFFFLYQPHPYEVDPRGQLGLGLLLLATYAKKLGASVRVINAQSLSIDEAAYLIPECDFLMMYGCLIDKPIIEEISKKVSSHSSPPIICVGGPIARSKVKYIDYPILGFGEDFVCSLTKGEFYWSPDKLDHDINYYPFPDRSLIEGEYGGNIFKEGGCGTSTTLLTSRGCRYRCAFCTSGSEDFVQDYSLSRIEKELEHCLSLGIKNIRISDDNLVSNRKRLMDLCDLLKRADVKWRGSIRVKPSHISMYEVMKESGCKELSFGVESGDQQVLNLLNKGITVDQSVAAIKNSRQAGIFTRALLMMGTPGESEDTLYRNMAWIEEAKPDMVSLKMFVPYPGTDIYHNPKKYRCKIHLPLREVNNSAYRPDKSEPVANIDNEYLSARKLTWQFLKMKSYLEAKGIENNG